MTRLGRTLFALAVAYLWYASAVVTVVTDPGWWCKEGTPESAMADYVPDGETSYITLTGSKGARDWMMKIRDGSLSIRSEDVSMVFSYPECVLIPVGNKGMKVPRCYAYPWPRTVPLRYRDSATPLPASAVRAWK